MHELVPVEHATEEGLLIARSALAMETKNHIIVSTLRDDLSFDAASVAGFVSTELGQLAREQAGYADRMDRSAIIASRRSGVARHQHDYRSSDFDALTHRAVIYRSLASALEKLQQDDGYVADIVEAARERAWNEVATAIENRLDDAPPRVIAGGTVRRRRSIPVVDRDYRSGLSDRLALLIDVDLAALAIAQKPKKG